MKHNFFPLFIPVTGKRALIIGGGAVALRRVRTLLQFDCAVHVIAEEPCPELAAFAQHEPLATHAPLAQHEPLASFASQTPHAPLAPHEPQAAVTLEQRAYCPGDCVKNGRPVLVVAATNNRAVNRAVAEECAAHAIPVSVADCAAESSFHFPAIVIHGTIVAGIGSGGQNHTAVRDAAAKIREVLHDDTHRDP